MDELNAELRKLRAQMPYPITQIRKVERRLASARRVVADMREGRR
jgi:hypothetical protein